MIIKVLFFVELLICVNCVIPNLSVRRFNKELIERKRQDTIDMCRMFVDNEQPVLPFTKSMFKRAKREVEDDQNLEDVAKVERIVEKLYEDGEEGYRVIYRRQTVPTQSTVKTVATLPARRFEFAPKVLEGDLHHENQFIHEGFRGRPGPFWHKHWKDGIVPYYIDANTYDGFLSETIEKAFDYFERSTCIRLQRLRERPTDERSLSSVEWLYIKNPSGIRQCVHSNFMKRNRGVQMVVLGYDCLSRGEIVHEVMHILGFPHEHTRHDRDHHITVLWDNIKPGYKKYFERRKQDYFAELPYDYDSVTHYPARAFSLNGQVTLLAEPGVKFGQRNGLSEGDIEKVGFIYGNECLNRNSQYLRQTCPTVVKNRPVQINVTKEDIDNYFNERLWPYGVVNYKIKDKIEFTIEERENINAVIRHIEKETCIKFNDMGKDENADNTDEDTTAADNSVELDSVTKSAKDEVVTQSKDKLWDVKFTNSNGIDQRENEVEPKDMDEPNDDSRRSDKTYRKRSADKETKSDSTKKINTDADKSVKKHARRVTAAVYRRHAAQAVVLARSAEPGCKCPPPGQPSDNIELVINTDCFNSVNDLLHLFVHVLGLDHQHNMHDRDSYLHINWKNLSPDIKNEMETTLPPAASLGLPYDYQSVMHYPWLQIKNGKSNIMYPIWNDGWTMGHWQGLSSMDVQKLDILYGNLCKKRQ